MTTKEWFQRGRRIDKRIDSLLLQKEEEWHRIISITSAPDAIVVDGTKDPHKFDNFAVLCAQIDEEIDKLYEVKVEIKEVVMRIPDKRYQDVLDKRYIGNKSWEQIAVEMNYSFRRITQLHGEALKIAEEVLSKSGQLQSVR